MTEPLVAGSRLALAVAGLALLGLANYVRGRSTPVARTFALLLGTLGLSALATTAAATVPWANKFAWLVAYLAIPLALALFSFDYYGLGYVDSRRRLAAFLAPVALATVGGVVGILGTTQYAATVPVAALGGLPGWVYAGATVAQRVGLYYAGGVMLVAVGLVFSTVGSYEHLDERLGVALSMVGVWPWIVYLVMPAVIGVVSGAVILAALAVCFLASVGLAALALWRYRLFDAAPAAGNLGPETVLEAVGDAVVVVDGDERVVRLNDAARETFGVTDAAAVGSDLSALVDADVASLRETGCFDLETTGGKRQFEATASAIRGRRGRRLGHALVFHDVTQRRTRRQRLTVLNRLLRHNLRNDMTAIIGRAEAIADEEEVDPQVIAEGILTTADDLVTLGERAREVERMMSVSDRLRPRADLEAVVETVVAEFDGDRIDVAIPAGTTVRADERLLEPVVRNLVDNAIEHADDPHVEVTATTDPARSPAIELRVADDGPGIPEQERRVVQSGDESALEHGSGLGLWAVKWGVTRMGGELEFDDAEPGTAVRVRLPAADGAEPTAATDAEPVGASAAAATVADGGP